MKPTLLLPICLIGLTFIRPAHAQLIINGGFETPDTRTYIEIYAGQKTIAPWVVGGHSVEVGDAIGNGFLVGPAFEGGQFLDLNGLQRGKLTQAFATISGLRYRVTFAYANNYYDSSAPASARVRVFDSSGDRLNQTITHSDSVAGDYNWAVFNEQFTALQSTTSLEFTSLTDTSGHTGGIILDAVQVVADQLLITNQPSSQAAAPGTTVTFQAGASSDEPIQYQWQKDAANGFIDLSERRNAVLVLTNVQPWDAGDYRLLVGNSLGVITSAVARLYVVRPPSVTTNVVIDNFDDNKLTGWLSEGHKGQVKLTETNQQFKVWGYWPGVSTVHADLADTESYGSRARNWSVLDGQTVEWRVDLVGLSENATMAGFALWSDAASAAYVLFKGHDFIHLCKPSLSVVERHGHFFHERALIQDTNVVLAVAVTRVNPDVIITVRVLDKANNNAVLYERSAVDTPRVDRTLTATELEAASGMHLHTGTDAGAPITSGSHVFLTVFQYNDGTRPPAEAIYDNLERWTSTFPVWRPEIAIQVSTNSTQVTLTLSAAPNSAWIVERAREIAGPWTNPTALVIGTNGTAQFQETDSASGAGFYRARQR